MCRWGVQAGVRQSRELQAEWQHKYVSIQGESAIMKHELDDVSQLSSPTLCRVIFHMSRHRRSSSGCPMISVSVLP